MGLAEAEAGITGPWPELERQLGMRGMMLGHRPENFEFSGLGGWIAAPLRRPGSRALRRSCTLAARGLTVATPQGPMTSGALPDLVPS